ncbi:MAG: restriction endonuclease [Desulfobacteraceae bacterium]|nr:restriction endonuclease [Desulfobacteraceae bacterium]
MDELIRRRTPNFMSILLEMAEKGSTKDLLKMEWEEFEAFIYFLLVRLGYDVRESGDKSEMGVDLIVTEEDALGFSTIGVIQCKRYSSRRSIGVDRVRELLFVLENIRANWGAIVSTSRFSAGASKEAKTFGTRIKLVGPKQLLEWARTAVNLAEDKAVSLSYRVSRLPLKTFGEIIIPDDKIVVPSDTESRLHLPKHYLERIEIVGHLPLNVIDRVLNDPRHIRHLSPRQFEEFIAEIVDTIGFKDVVLTTRSADGGKDIIASRVIEGIPVSFYFECKKYAEGNAVQLETLRSLLGTIAHDSRRANIGVLVTTSHFTAGCKRLIAGECRLDGKDYEGILGWIGKYKTWRQ